MMLTYLTVLTPYLTTLGRAALRPGPGSGAFRCPERMRPGLG